MTFLILFQDSLKIYFCVFGTRKKATPLTLYHRLIEKIDKSNEVGIGKIECGFREFYDKYLDTVKNNKLKEIPKNAIIRYGDSKKVYIEIGMFIRQSNKRGKESIRQYLLAIGLELYPDEDIAEELEKSIDIAEQESPEGDFISNIMNKAKETMEGIDAENPAAAIMGLMQSGIVQELIGGIQTGVASGEMDPKRLISGMQNSLGVIMEQAKESGMTEEEIQENMSMGSKLVGNMLPQQSEEPEE